MELHKVKTLSEPELARLREEALVLSRDQFAAAQARGEILLCVINAIVAIRPATSDNRKKEALQQADGLSRR